MDGLTYTYPYHAKNHVGMLPPDCIDHERNSNNFTDIEHHLHSFNVRHPLLQLRLNKHANEHRPSCFKKGCECRNNLPEAHQDVATISFEENFFAISFALLWSSESLLMLFCKAYNPAAAKYPT